MKQFHSPSKIFFVNFGIKLLYKNTNFKYCKSLLLKSMILKLIFLINYFLIMLKNKIIVSRETIICNYKTSLKIFINK